MVVTVIGLGFVGLTTALAFSEYGHTVYGVEKNEERRSLIASGRIPFYEPGLGEALRRHLGRSFFPVAEDGAYRKAVSESDIVYFCVGTPYGENGHADLTALFGALDECLACLDESFRVFVVKSTVPPSTTKDRIIPYIEGKGRRVPEELGVANNPEFLREGHCWEDVMHSDFIALGVEDERSRQLLTGLYANAGTPVFPVSLNTGEFLKYLSNTSLALLISFANEMSIAAGAIGDIEIRKAFEILHTEKRWRTGSIRSYFYPGCGYGGYCLPKDTNAFLALSRDRGCDSGMLEQLIRVNDGMPEASAEKIAAAAGGDSRKRIGILGLSFNVGSDDCRDTPAAKIIAALFEKGYRSLYAYDPVAEDAFRRSYGAEPYGAELHYCASLQEIAACCDVFAIATAWPEFSGIRALTDRPVVDLRYML